MNVINKLTPCYSNDQHKKKITALFPPWILLPKIHWNPVLGIFIHKTKEMVNRILFLPNLTWNITAIPKWAIFRPHSRLQGPTAVLVPAQAQLGWAGIPLLPTPDSKYTKSFINCFYQPVPFSPLSLQTRCSCWNSLSPFSGLANSTCPSSPFWKVTASARF